MELRCLHSITLSSIPRCGLTDSSFLHGHATIKSPICRKNSSDVKKTKLLVFRARTSGITKIKSQAKDASPSNAGTKDGNVVFVAGATGKVGSRAVRELLELGFKVRAGVRSVKRAESLVQSVQKMKLEDVAGGAQAMDKLELVECDLEKQDQIEPALGNSSIVMCCIGASEKEILDISGPYRIDYQATKNLIDAATSAKVNHFILLTSLGTNKVGFPAAILNLFWGVLLWKRKAEEALLASGLPYTIVRPGGMERPTDSFKETHNITLSEQDTLFGGLVSNLQVAELMAFIAKNHSLSCCKVLEVTAETSAPLTPMGELLEKIPSDRGKVCPPPKESDGPSESKQVPDSIHAVKEPEITKPTPSTPSSPYIAYEDLKPPTSPTPTMPVSTSKVEIPPTETISDLEVISVETSSVINGNIAPEIELKKQYSSSPYSNYEDLKPPTTPTPTPTPSGSKKTLSTLLTPPLVVAAEPQITGGNDIAKIGSTIASDHSPYLAYADLKPPTSPSPSVPALSGNGKPAESPSVDENLNYPTEPKATPLSPYTMYEDLKPPTSPLPLPKKL